MNPLKVAYLCAPTDKDERLREKLQAHLGALKHSGQILSWYDRLILPGKDREQEIEENLGDAHIVLLLVSPDFISLGYCSSRQIQQALRRHEMGITHVIPVIIRPVEWKETLIGTLQALPYNERPITSWSNQDKAFQDVAQGIQKVVSTLNQSRNRKMTALECFSKSLPCCPRCGSSLFLDFSDDRFIWCGACGSDVIWVDLDGRLFALSDKEASGELISKNQRKSL